MYKDTCYERLLLLSKCSSSKMQCVSNVSASVMQQHVMLCQQVSCLAAAIVTHV